jgi:hypothetical protein
MLARRSTSLTTSRRSQSMMPTVITEKKIKHKKQNQQIKKNIFYLLFPFVNEVAPEADRLVVVEVAMKMIMMMRGAAAMTHRR